MTPLAFDKYQLERQSVGENLSLAPAADRKIGSGKGRVCLSMQCRRNCSGAARIPFLSHSGVATVYCIYIYIRDGGVCVCLCARV